MATTAPSVPDRLGVAGFDLATLTRYDLEPDLAAVMESIDLLAGMFGDDWPLGMTREQDLADLLWHEEETRTGRSFAWVIRTAAGDYAGCAYLKPALAGEGWRAPYWFRLAYRDAAAIEAFDAGWRTTVDGWIGAPVEVTRRTAFHSG